MTDDRRIRADRLFERALELSERRRREYVDRACAGDPQLAGEVLALLEAAERSASFLERPAEECLDLPWEEVIPAEEPRVEADHAGRAGELVGPYRLVRRIGRGGMASVYLAERADGQWRQEVAIKVIRRGIDTEDVVRRFFAERQILSSLTHPNIARLLDGGTTPDGLPYLVMEHVAGIPIDRHCDERRLGIADRLRLFCEVGRAVQHAHRRLVVHRDLKPSNILIDSEGRVKLLDFGIAKLLEESSRGEFTVAGLRPLTPSWASPEQIRGEPITTASDVYQLGLLLCALLTGRLPYEPRALSPAIAERAIAEAEPARPSALVTGPAAAARGAEPHALDARIRGDLDTIVLRALRKEPEERYLSAESLVEDVERHLAGQPVRARPDTLGYRARKFVARNRIGVAAAAAFVLLLAASSFVATLQAGRLARERDRARSGEARAEQVTEFVTELFRAADPNELGRPDVTALELLDAGTARALQELSGDPRAQAAVLGTIGAMYIRRGHHSRAAPVLDQAVSLRRSMGGDPAGLVLDLRRLAEAVRGSDPDRALALLRESVSIAERELGPGDAAIAAALTDLADHTMKSRQPDAPFVSRLLLERALEILDEQPGDVRRQRSDALLLLAHLEEDRAASVALFQEALDLKRALHGEDHTGVAAIVNDMALRIEPLDPLAADTLLERAVEINARIHGPHHSQTLTMMNNLAGRWRDRGDHAKAVALYREVLRRRQTAYPDNLMGRAYTLHGLAWSLTEVGRAAESEPLLREALATLAEAFGTEHIVYQMARSTLGRSIAAQGRYAEAEPMLRESYEWAAENDPVPVFIPFMLDRLVRLYEDWGRIPEADRYRDLRRGWETRPASE